MLKYRPPRVSIVPRSVLKPKPKPRRDILYVASSSLDFGSGSRITLHRILEVVSRISGVTVQEMVAPRRATRICNVRHCVMWLAKKHTKMSLPQIGAGLGNRDHSTISHGVNKVEKNLPKYLDFLRKCEFELLVDKAENHGADYQPTDKSDRLAA